eukprot:CAMPEP_0197018956 /NCGR_PEP_ID=MMETSP1380-20130617/80409_1 /TAXON_ID=5936 /ORGANISM="Euplotes crassus, Strain CT5" /LENGTH=209 /DNA_ID=CAMNT_0042446273 /DNA_START=635 /DNA_END=1264 /DNA_ORIENTATION=+
MKNLASFVYTYTGYDIRGRSLFRIIEGIIIGIFNIKNMGMEVIRKVLEHTENAIEKDWKNVWSDGVSTIKIEFIQKIYDAMCQRLEMYPKELRWVLRTHLLNFVVDKEFRDEADQGFIIRKYLDEEGVKMLSELEHSGIDQAPDSSEDGFQQYKDPLLDGGDGGDAGDAGEYKGFIPKQVRDEIAPSIPKEETKEMDEPKNIRDQWGKN